MYKSLSRWLIGTTLLCAGVSAAAAPASFDVGTMHVQQYDSTTANAGRPLILIPGLASGGWVWDDTVKRYAGSHALYVVSLAGFDGRPAVPGPQMAQAQAALLALITSHHIDHPVLIGHSLGGTLSLAFAARHADLISGVVSVDGLPVFPGTENVEPALRPAMADASSAGMRGVDASQFAAQQQSYMRGTGVQDMDLADDLAKRMATSDPATVATYIGELLRADDRPALASIKVPVLLIAPYAAADANQYHISEQAKRDYYRSLMAGTPQLGVQMIAPARHFVMFDQPEQFGDSIAAYLKKLPQ